jgi:hypothetical protein
MPSVRGFIVELAVMLAVGFALAAIGPFGSFGLGNFADRVAYWVPAALGGYLLVRPTLILAALAGRSLRIAEPLAMSAGVLVAGLPMTFFILWLNGNDLTGLPAFQGWFQLYVQVVLIGGMVTLLFWLMERPARAGSSQPDLQSDSTPAEPTAHAAPFLARLPPHLRSGLIALEMEDHYVRAHTKDGSALILIRMRDAVAELSTVEGMQVHRSWWVARSAVKQAIPSGRGVRLTLDGGVEAPVARSSIPALRAAGWLDRERQDRG